MNEYLTTAETARYLRLGERKLYELVAQGRIPCTKATGKWLFPKSALDRWLAAGLLVPDGLVAAPAPAIVAGSHDPLLEWSLRDSACGLALMAGGSLDGLRRVLGGEALLCGMHVLDGASGQYNVPELEAAHEGRGLVLIEWAWRSQGLVLAPGNPLGIRTVRDLLARHPRVVEREPEAGTHVLLAHLLRAAGVDAAALKVLPRVARSQTDVGLAVLEGRADTGLGVEAVARQFRLEFLPLHRERYDLAMQRRSYFEPQVQALLAFARSDGFRARAAEMGGYDVSGLGTVRFNGP